MDPKAKSPGQIKHMEMIQAVITRMANNSFMIRGWCVTLVSVYTKNLTPSPFVQKLMRNCYQHIALFFFGRFFILGLSCIGEIESYNGSHEPRKKRTEVSYLLY